MTDANNNTNNPSYLSQAPAFNAEQRVRQLKGVISLYKYFTRADFTGYKDAFIFWKEALNAGYHCERITGNTNTIFYRK